MTKFSIGLIVSSFLLACSSPGTPEQTGDAGGATNDAPSGGACTVAISGAVTATTSCILAAVDDGEGLHFGLSTTNGMFAFAADLPGASLTTGDFPLSATTKTSATVDQSTAVWSVFYDDGQHTNQGDATFTITTIGQSAGGSTGVAWINEHGTLTATLQPADSFATGTVTVTASF